MNKIKILKNITFFLLTLFVFSGINGQDCISYPDIEGTPCKDCAPAGWIDDNIFFIWVHIIPPVNNVPLPDTNCGNIQNISGPSPTGGNVVLLFGDDNNDNITTIETTISGLDTEITYVFGMYWEGISVDCAINDYNGGVLKITIEGEVYEFSDADDWELAEVCFKPSSSSVDVLISTYDPGNHSAIIIDGNPSCSALSQCCTLESSITDDNFSICPGETILLDAQFDYAIGSTSIEWTSIPADGINYLSATDVIAPTFTLPTSSSDFFGETYKFTLTVEDDVCEQIIECVEVEVRPEVVPVFDLELCNLDLIAILPSTSDNNYSGTWTGDFNIEFAAGTFVPFTFNLNSWENNCIESYDFSFYVNEGYTPTFDLEEMFCLSDSSDYTLPALSLENNIGEWFPNNTINPAELGLGAYTYLFVPDSFEEINFCVSDYEFNFEIIEDSSISFNLPSEFCVDTNEFILPLLSLEGDSGTWSIDTIDLSIPVMNQHSIFTLNQTNFCAQNYTYEYSINEFITPSFSINQYYCDNDTIFELPETSLDSIPGTWNFSTIDPSMQDSLNIVYTPSVGLCNLAFSQTLYFKEYLNPEFSLPSIMCVNDSIFTFPLISDNGINGTWDLSSLDPSTYNQTVFTNTFIPDNSNCTSSFITSITILNFQDITINLTNPSSCSAQNGVIEILGASSDMEQSNDNGGTWTPISDLTDLAGGTYNIHIRYKSTPSCVQLYSLQLNSSESPEINELIVTDATSCSENNGNIECIASGNNLEFSIDGMNWQSNNTFNDLSIGNYTIYVRLAHEIDCITSSMANVGPNTVEICDGIDNDCNGEIDENLPTENYYADNDMDGFGNPNDVISSCSAPQGYVLDNTDCDDSNAMIHPSTNETCDGLDNNCNGAIDENLPTENYYADNDMDGFGNPTDVITSCTAPQGYVLDNTDCDDSNAMIHPSAIENCDGLDNNCNEAIDENLPTENYYADSDMDGFGNPNNVISSCSVPQGFVLDNTDCNDSDDSIYPGATEIVNNGIDEDCDGSDLISALHELSGQELKIYPNPTNGMVEITMNDSRDVTISLYNINGKRIISQKTLGRINLEEYANGIYLLKISNRSTKEFIVERIVLSK